MPVEPQDTTPVHSVLEVFFWSIFKFTHTARKLLHTHVVQAIAPYSRADPWQPRLARGSKAKGVALHRDPPEGVVSGLWQALPRTGMRPRTLSALHRGHEDPAPQLRCQSLCKTTVSWDSTSTGQGTGTRESLLSPLTGGSARLRVPTEGWGVSTDPRPRPRPQRRFGPGSI